MALPNSVKTPVNAFSLSEGDRKQSASAMPIKVCLLGEPNTANEASLSINPIAVSTKKDVADICGYGSLPYLAMEILENAEFETFLFPQKYSTTSVPTSTVLTLAIDAGTGATANATHYINFNEKRTAFNVVKGDTDSEINAKILDAYNGILANSAIAEDNAGDVDFTVKWKGATSAKADLTIDVGDEDAGITYSVIAVYGTGTPSIQASLDLFGNDWYNVVINPYDENVFDTLEVFNGKPGVSLQTGRWAQTVQKPFIAFMGSNASTLAEAESITDVGDRKTEVTNVACAAPNSRQFPVQIACNAVLLQCSITNVKASLSGLGQPYPFAVVGSSLGDMANVVGRNNISKAGHSTVDINNGDYIMMDFITTYHPDGDESPIWKRVRDVFVDMNIMYFWDIVAQLKIKGKVLLSNNSEVGDSDAIKPLTIEGIVDSFIDDMGDKLFIADTEYSKNTKVVSISPENRVNVGFGYLRTSIAEQVDVSAKVNFFTTI